MPQTKFSTKNFNSIPYFLGYDTSLISDMTIKAGNYIKIPREHFRLNHFAPLLAMEADEVVVHK